MDTSVQKIDMRKVDRRKIRTRRLLQEAMYELIESKAFAEITVEELVKVADIGRSTFYLHYRDKEHLLSECARIDAEAIEARTEALAFTSEGEFTRASVLYVFRHVQERANFYRTVLSGEGGVRPLRRFNIEVARVAQARFEMQITQLGLTPMMPVELIAQHFTGALLAMVRWWLQEGLELYSAEEMTELFRQITVEGRAHVIGGSR